MIGIISEYKYSNEELIKLRKQGCVVNYTLLPQYYADYSAEISRINNALISKCNALIFRIETFYVGTKESIEKALYYKKPCKIYYDGKDYMLNTLDEWRLTTGYGTNSTSYKHPLLQAYEGQRTEYFEAKRARVLTERFRIATEGITIDETEVYNIVNQFKYLYDIQVDMESKQDVYMSYRSISYYLDNNIEYSNEPQSTEEEFPFEIISFGDPCYLEDYIYKNKVIA